MSNLLTQKDKTVCENIVKIGDSINAKRAKALLLIDSGNTHIEAAENSTLSIGQVRYALAKFRSIGLAFFPTEFSVVKKEITPREETQTIIKEEPIEEEMPQIIIKTKKKKKEKEEKAKKTKSSKVKKDSKKKDKKSKSKKIKKDSKKKSKKNSKVSKKKSKKSKKKSKK